MLITCSDCEYHLLMKCLCCYFLFTVKSSFLHRVCLVVLMLSVMCIIMNQVQDIMHSSVSASRRLYFVSENSMCHNKFQILSLFKFTVEPLYYFQV